MGLSGRRLGIIQRLYLVAHFLAIDTFLGMALINLIQQIDPGTNRAHRLADTILQRLAAAEHGSGLIDGVAVNGSAGAVGLVAALVRKLQSGYLYHYAFAMILGLVALLALANHYWL